MHAHDIPGFGDGDAHFAVEFFLPLALDLVVAMPILPCNFPSSGIMPGHSP
jgi:hypothetical protein